MYLRNATAYGVSRRLRADIVVNNLVGHAVTTGKVLLQSDGSPWRPLVHIRDIIAAFQACLDAPRDAIHNQAFNVGTQRRELPHPRRRRDRQQRSCPSARSRSPPAPRRTPATTASTSARSPTKLPAFTPTWTLRAGIEELYRAYTANELTKDEWDGWRYYRLKAVKRLQDQGRIDEDLRRIPA